MGYIHSLLQRISRPSSTFPWCKQISLLVPKSAKSSTQQQPAAGEEQWRGCCLCGSSSAQGQPGPKDRGALQLQVRFFSSSAALQRLGSCKLSGDSISKLVCMNAKRIDSFGIWIKNQWRHLENYDWPCQYAQLRLKQKEAIIISLKAWTTVSVNFYLLHNNHVSF